MSYIIKDTDAFINAKLTDYGREQLASGKLTFGYYAFGDSEIDYMSLENFDLKLTNILRPKDSNTDLRYPIKAAEADVEPYQSIGTLTPVRQVITNVAPTRGFFSGNGLTENFDTTLVKQNEIIVYLSGLTGGTNIQVFQEATYGATTYEPQAGDLLLIKYNHPNLAITQAKDVVEDSPVPYLWYSIEAVGGSLSANTLSLFLDRNTADFSLYGAISDFAYVKVYPGGNAILEYYGSATTIPYWNELTVSFDNTCDLSIDDVPVWNMNVPFTEGVAGVSSVTYEDFEKYGSTGYCGTKQFIEDTFEVPAQKSIAIIHYTNNTISNVYGERLLDSTQLLTLPTIMWHKRPFSGSGTATDIGITLSAATTEQTITSSFNNNSILRYYDLVDTTANLNVVGKVFPDYKIFVIEDEELVMAMSYKSNRNWSLPQLQGGVETTAGTTLFDTFNDFYITYILGSSSGYTSGVHCGYYTKLTKTGNSPVKIACYFDAANSSTFPYMTDGTDGTGWQASSFYIIAQKTLTDVRPDPKQWKIMNFTDASFLFSGSTLIDPVALENTVFEITYADYVSASTYNLDSFVNIPLKTEPSLLQFGDENFFFGMVETEIAATSYRTSFVFTLNPLQFNISQNPTFADVTRNVHISEIGIYDNSKNMVAVGKISNPIEKHDNKTVVIELSIDF